MFNKANGYLDGSLRFSVNRLARRHDVVGDVRALPVAFEIGPVPPDAEHDPVAELDRVDLARVDRTEIGHERLEALVAVLAEVEAPQPRETILIAGGFAAIAFGFISSGPDAVSNE